MKQKQRLHFILILALVAVNLFVFLPSMDGDFLWDDRYFISENPNLLGPHFLERFLTGPFGGFSGLDENSKRLDRIRQFYRPLSSFSYWLDLKIWGLNPASFHFTNILMHTLNVIILYFILINLGLSSLSCFFGALLFSVFPLHFENVSWISGRTDLLSFLFASLSVLFFLKFLRRERYSFLVLSSFLLFFSLFAKENSLLLFVIYFFLLLRRESKLKDFFLLIFPYCLSFLGWLILRGIALGSIAFEFSGRTLFDFFSVVGFYTCRIIFPLNLGVTIDSYEVFKNILFLIAGFFVSLFFVVSAFYLLKKSKIKSPFIVAFFSFYLLLLPSAVIIFSSSTVSYMAWRFLYAPSAVVLSFLAFFLFKKIKYGPIPVVLVSLLVLLYAQEIYPKNKLFGNSETDFWLGIKKVEREGSIAKVNIGLQYLPKDEKRAVEIFNSVLVQKNHHLYEVVETRICEELATYYTFKRDFSMAEQYFNRLLKRYENQSQNFLFNYSYFLALTGKMEEGEQIIQRLLRVFPENHLVLIHSAKFYVLLEDHQEASKLLEKDYKLFRTKDTLRSLQELQKR